MIAGSEGEEGFSPQQYKVLNLAASGYTDKEIAIQLGISRWTIRCYWDRMRNKFEARSRSELIAKSLSRLLDEVSRQRSQLISCFDFAEFGVAFIDGQAKIIDANRAFSELFGYDIAELRGFPLRNLSPECQRPVIDLAFKRVWDGQKMRNVEWVGLKQDGQFVFLSVSAKTIQTCGVEQILVNADSLTSEANLADLLTEGESRFRKIANRMERLVWTSTPNGEIDFCNMHWAQFTGNPVEKYIGEGCRLLMDGCDLSLSRDRFRWASENQASYKAEVNFLGVDAHYKPHQIELTPVCNASGELVRWIGSAFELS